MAALVVALVGTTGTLPRPSVPARTGNPTSSHRIERVLALKQLVGN